MKLLVIGFDPFGGESVNPTYESGIYVCNSVMYRVLHLAARSYPNMKAGFIHVPYSSEQVANKDRPLASMPIETIAKSLEHAIEAVVKE